MRYEDFETATGYGTGPGLCGWNCRYNFYPFFPGISAPNYTAERLAELDARKIAYGGQLHTLYEIRQMRRALERRVRKYERRFLAEKAAGQDTTLTSVRMRDARRALNAFAEATGDKVDGARTEVTGFGYREALQSTTQVKVNTLTNAVGAEIIRITRTTRNGNPGSITQKENAKGGIDRNYYGPDGRQTKQISNNDHGHKAERGFGQQGEHAHDYTWDEHGQMYHGKARELTEEERKENADIL